MPVTPDDLPRSASGRVPQWVIDEAHGLRAEPDGWRTYAPMTPPGGSARRRWTGSVAVVGVAVLASGWWLTGGMAALPGGAAAELGPAAGAGPLDPPAVPVPAPTADVVALADAAHLSDEGRQLFYGARPEVLDELAFAGRCGAALTEGTGMGVVGCYHHAPESIVLYRPADPRLTPAVVDSAAHEMLHAAWTRLTAADHQRLTPLLEAEVASIPTSDPIHQQIAGSVGSRTDSRPTELFAYVGTQVWREGGLAPELEAAYGRFIADRPALVAVERGLDVLLDGMQADIDAASQALAAREIATTTERLQLAADAASVARYEQTLEDEVAEFSAMPPEYREGLKLSWRWWDGTDLPLGPADETLAAAAELLLRDRGDLSTREAAITAADDEAAAERARIQALAADLGMLRDQLIPGSPTS